MSIYTINNSVTNLIRDLNYQLSEENDIFNLNMLYLLEKHLGFDNTGITFYDENYNLVDVISNNEAIYLRNDYINDFHNKDIIAHYISENVSILRKDINVLTNSALSLEFTEQKGSLDLYNDFLKNADFSYVAVVPLDRIRMCFYKKEKDGDFTQNELSELYFVGKILQTYIPLNEHFKERQLLNNMYDQYFSNKKNRNSGLKC